MFLFYSLVSFNIHFIIYWYMVFLYDMTNDKIPKKVLSKSIKNSIKNQFTITLPSLILFYYYYPIQYDNLLSSFLYYPILIIIGDCYFYLSHRPLHTKLLYKYHQTHHTGIIHVSKSLDADCIEHIFGNIGSFIIGVLLLQHHGLILNIYAFNIWLGISTFNVCLSHSNGQNKYDDKIHYNHHKYLNCNYGTGFYLLDKIMGSYKTNK